MVAPTRELGMQIASDITDFKKSQEIIAMKNKELEQIVFVTSHDLRSPLINVDGYSREIEYSLKEIMNVLETEDASPNNLEDTIHSVLPDMKDSLFHIRKSTKQMDALLKGLLNFSRSGRAALNIVDLNMNALIDELIASFEFQVKEMGVTIEIGELPQCRGDKVQVNQVFTNLLDNALKYLHPTRLGVIQVTGTIEVNNRCIYCVEDNGIGIASENQTVIFELFHRLNPSKTEGEGLGLTIVQQTLERMNGEIRVESNLGKGSRFYVSLPHVNRNVFE